MWRGIGAIFMKRSNYIKKEKQVKVSEEMMIALARDLKEGHDAKTFNVHYWPAAQMVIARFYKKED